MRIPQDTANHLLRYIQTADTDQRQALRYALDYFISREYDAAFECLDAAGLSSVRHTRQILARDAS